MHKQVCVFYFCWLNEFICSCVSFCVRLCLSYFCVPHPTQHTLWGVNAHLPMCAVLCHFVCLCRINFFSVICLCHIRHSIVGGRKCSFTHVCHFVSFVLCHILCAGWDCILCGGVDAYLPICVEFSFCAGFLKLHRNI